MGSVTILMTNPLVGHEWGAPWTIDDLADLPDDGNRYEILDGSLLVSPPPDIFHGRATTDLGNLLQRTAPADLYVSSVGFGVNVRGGSYYVPDVIVFRRSAFARWARAIEPADTLLVAEVLSPSNAGRDLVTKRHEYAAVGIPQYWIVDQDERTVTVLTLDGRRYHQTAVVGAGERIKTDDPFPIDFDPAEIF